MRSAANTFATGENALMPIARIDAQDEPSVLPLREYLETHGVAVFVNTPHDRETTYYIVIGESDFVKQIFSRANDRKAKRLAISIGYSAHDPEPRELHSKIIFIDPKAISRDHVIDMFEYFFTSDNDILDMRTRRDTRIVREHAPVVDDQERIGHLMKDVFGEDAKPEVRKKEEQSRRRRKKQRQWGIGVLIGLGMIIFSLFWYLVSVTISGAALAASEKSMVAGNMDAAGWQSRMATYWIGQGNMVLHVAAVPLSWVGWEGSVRGQERLLSFFSDAAMASEEVNSMSGVSQSVASGLLNQVNVTSTGTTPAADIMKLQVSLDSVQNTLGLAQAELALLLRDQTFPFSVPFIARGGTRIIPELVTLRDSAATMDELVSLFLQIAGFKEPRTYLILLQNSTELRPTGGFIGSVALASFADGRMTDFQVQDVYTFDGQLKGHVDPPTPVRELLSQEHWYLRDSNWDPDFSVSAAKAAWFYQKETGSTVDGVFALNTPFIIDILKATGPIDLSDYNDRITADNFYGKSLYYTQNDFFPGSTQKKDFLGSLTRSLITKMTTSRTTNVTTLFRAITTALTGHDFLMMFGSPQLQSMIAHYGWAGGVPSTTGCTGADAAQCSFDPFIEVEANMGVNKANYFMSRALNRQLTIDTDGGISETVTMIIKNTSGQDQGLPYRTYVRFLLSPDVAVSGVMLDGAPVPSRKDTTTTPVLPYTERTDTTSSFYVLGVGVYVPAGSQKQLAITYTRGNIVHFGDSGAVVDLFIQKQPGVDVTPVHTVIRYPATWVAGVEGQGDFIANAGQLEYNTVLDRDMLTRIRFTK